MTSVEDKFERRKDQRFTVCAQAIAVVKSGDHSTKIGRVVDVSQGGLAFDYVLLDGVTSDCDVRNDAVGAAFLDILTEEGHVALHNVLIRTVSDRLLEPQQPSFSSLPVRRCGVSFSGLSLEQRTELGDFLVRNAISDEAVAS